MAIVREVILVPAPTRMERDFVLRVSEKCESIQIKEILSNGFIEISYKYSGVSDACCVEIWRPYMFVTKGFD